MQDGLRAGLFSIEKVATIPYLSKIVKKHQKKLKNFRKEIIINQIIRDLINLMVTDVINTTKKNLKRNKLKNEIDVYNHYEKIAHFSQKTSEIDNQVKDFLKHNMYNNNKVLANTERGKLIIKDLFKYLLNNYKKYINKELLKIESKERLVADFIAGMTDRFAINLYNKIK